MALNIESELTRMEKAFDNSVGGEGNGERTTTRDYTADEVFVKLKTADRHGHSEVIAGRIHPRMAAVIGKLVEGRGFPIASKSEFVNLACYHFLRELQHLDPSAPSTEGRIQGLAALVDDEKLVDDYNTTFAKAVEVVEARMAQGMEREARRIAMRFLSDIDLMPERSDWKKRWRAEAGEAFERILGGE